MLKNMMVASAIAAGAIVPTVGAAPVTFDQCYLTGTSCGPGLLQGTLGGVGRGTDNLLVGLLGSPQTGTGLLGALLNAGR
jgi:hypothetical protein